MTDQDQDTAADQRDDQDSTGAGPELELEPDDGDTDQLEPDDQRDGHDGDDPDDGDQFSREYVERLRREAGDHRKKAAETAERADQLARALWDARVAAAGILADPRDLPYDPDILDDPDSITAAARKLVAERPHLRATRITGPAWQGPRDGGAACVSLGGLLRQRA